MSDGYEPHDTISLAVPHRTVRPDWSSHARWGRGVPGVVQLGWVWEGLYRYPPRYPPRDPYYPISKTKPYLRPNEGLSKVSMRFLR